MERYLIPVFVIILILGFILNDPKNESQKAQIDESVQSGLQNLEDKIIRAIDPEFDPNQRGHGGPRRLHHYRRFSSTRDHAFQEEYERAVREHDRRNVGLPPGLPFPCGRTFQQIIDSGR